MFVGKWIPHPNNTSALITVLTHLTLRVLPFFNQGSLLSIRSGKLNCHHIHIKVFSSISQWSFSVPPQVWEGEDLQLHRRGGGVRQSLPCHEHLRPRHHRAVQGPRAVREAAPPLRHRRRCLQSHEEEEQRHVYRHLRYHGKPPSPPLLHGPDTKHKDDSLSRIVTSFLKNFCRIGKINKSPAVTVYYFLSSSDVFCSREVLEKF